MLPAQTVTVPAGCTVVVPGVNGNTAMGIVGHGGIVCMPDPHAAPPPSTFVGGTVINWILSGDISILAAITPPTPAIQIQNGGSQAKIMSYNKSYRSNPITFENSNPSRARSKGRVHVNYVQGACNNYIEYDILKTWTTPNPSIVGASCWLPNTQYVYAVDIASGDNVLDAIGFDKYYWVVLDPNGLVVGGFANNSAESSSIVFTTPGVILPGTYTIKCCFGQCNPWNNNTNSFPGTPGFPNTFPGTSCVTKPIQSQPVVATAFPTCIPMTDTSWPLINITPLPGYTYAYTAPCAWTLTPSGGQLEDLTITGIDKNPCTITQTMVGPCGTSVFQYVINRTYSANTPLLSANSTCIAAPGSVTISFPADALNNATTWSGVPWTHNGNGTHTVETFNIPAGTCAGAYTICATNIYCTGGSTCITINVKPALPVITGPICVPYGTGAAVTYNSTTPCGVAANAFNWSNTFIPAWAPSPASTTSSINYLPTGLNNGVIHVIANGTNGCNSVQANLLVNRTPAPPSVNAPLCFNVGVPGTGVVFNVSAPVQSSANTYTWAFDPLFSAGGGTTGSSVTRTTTGATGTFPCTVTNANACGSVMIPFSPVVSYGTATVSANNSFADHTDLGASPTGQQSYTLWNCNTSIAGPTQTGVGAHTFLLQGSTVDGLYSITILTTAGCLVQPPCVLTNFSAMPLNGGKGIQVGGEDRRMDPASTDPLVVSPNPNTGTFTLQVDRTFRAGTAMLYDAKGVAVGALVKLNPGRNELGSKDLAPGSYTLSIDLDDEVQNKTIIVSEE